MYKMFVLFVSGKYNVVICYIRYYKKKEFKIYCIYIQSVLLKPNSLIVVLLIVFVQKFKDSGFW